MFILALSLDGYEQSCALATINPPTALGTQLKRLHGDLTNTWALTHGAAREGELVEAKEACTRLTSDTRTIIHPDHQHQGSPALHPTHPRGCAGLLSGAHLHPISPLCVAIQSTGSGAPIPTLALSSSSNQSPF